MLYQKNVPWVIADPTPTHKRHRKLNSDIKKSVCEYLTQLPLMYMPHARYVSGARRCVNSFAKGRFKILKLYWFCFNWFLCGDPPCAQSLAKTSHVQQWHLVNLVTLSVIPFCPSKICMWCLYTSRHRIYLDVVLIDEWNIAICILSDTRSHEFGILWREGMKYWNTSLC